MLYQVREHSLPTPVTFLILCWWCSVASHHSLAPQQVPLSLEHLSGVIISIFPDAILMGEHKDPSDTEVSSSEQEEANLVLQVLQACRLVQRFEHSLSEAMVGEHHTLEILHRCHVERSHKRLRDIEDELGCILNTMHQNGLSVSKSDTPHSFKHPCIAKSGESGRANGVSSSPEV
ncbi:hypothetical protein JVT61DRAFT_8366 [Boletus reticuloceps]|uniref:Uncharacterized protein n=1 Tax=Boletus reticuloceps TaxID=495285 RepID=A0A8I3AFA2_9AGAM|nr:hypothetical protein JVT61DRAFT_8366 [Boletus reticuloceps]